MTKHDKYSRKSTPVNEKEKERKCLMCLTMFMSEGLGNRICNECKKTTAYKIGNLNYHSVLR